MELKTTPILTTPIGVVAMDVISLGLVGMGVLNACFVGMGVLVVGVNVMGVWWAGVEGMGRGAWGLLPVPCISTITVPPARRR